MRIHTLLAIAATMFVLPALAAQPSVPVAPPVMPTPPKFSATPLERTAGEPDIDIVYEVRLLKVPAGFRERVGLKDDAVLTDGDLLRVVEAAQNHRDANVMQFPKITAFNGQECTVRNTEQQSFTTSLEAMKLKGQSVCIPKNQTFELGEVLMVHGRASANARTVTVRAKLVHTALVGKVELVPVVTQITPIFEGGSQGKPIAFTQFLQVPNIKTEQLEKNIAVSANTTIVLGGWKEAGEPPAQGKVLRKKEKPAAEYEVVALATVRAVRNEEPSASVAPMPREMPELVKKSFSISDLVLGRTVDGEAIRRGREVRASRANEYVQIITARVRPGSWQTNGGKGTAEYVDRDCTIVVTNAAEAVDEVGDLLEALRLLQDQAPDVAPMPHKVSNQATYKLRNTAAADIADAMNRFLRGSNLTGVVVAEPVSNTLLVSAEPELQKQLLSIIADLDKAPTLVMVQAMFLEVPRGFAARSGLDIGGTPGANLWTLSPREARMFGELIRAAKGREECDILARPQLLLNDNQTGFVQVGQQFPYLAAIEPGVEQAGGSTPPKQKVEYEQLGLTLKVTPRVSPDGKSVLLAADANLSTVAGNVSLGNGILAPAFNVQSTSVSADVRTGETLIFALDAGSGSFLRTIRAQFGDRDQRETLVIITPIIVEPGRPAGGLPK